MGKYASVPVLEATKERLDDFGKKGESYDELLNRLLDSIEGKKVEARVR